MREDETGPSLFNFGKGTADTAELIKKIAIGGAVQSGVLILFKVKEALD